MLVTINFGKRTIQLEVDQTISVLDLKQKIQDKEQIHPQYQKLSIDGTRLKNNRKLSDYKHSEPILLEHKTRSFCVRLMEKGGNERGPVNFENYDCQEKIKSIKIKLSEEYNISPAKQGLAYNGVRLNDDEKTLLECKIKNGAILFLVELTTAATEIKKATIFIKDKTNKTVGFEIDPTDSIKAIKEQIKASGNFGALPNEIILIAGGKELDDSKTPNDYSLYSDTSIFLGISVFLDISVQAPDNETIKLRVKSSDFVRDLRAQVQKELGPEYNYNLMDSNDELLEDDKPLSDYHIKSGDSITVKKQGFLVFIKTPEGKLLSIEIDPTKTIYFLKKEIEKKTSISAEKQLLFYSGEVLEDSKLISDYDFNSESTMNLEVIVEQKPEDTLITIFIQTMDNRKLYIEIDPNKTIYLLKKEIEKKISILAEKQRLIYARDVLEDSKLISDYSLNSESTMNLEEIMEEIKLIEIFVKHNNDKSKRINVDPDGTVEAVKSTILKHFDSFSLDHALFFDKKNAKETEKIELENKKRLSDYGIKGGDLLRFQDPVSSKNVLFVQMAGRKPISLEIDPNTRIDELKMLISKETSFPVNEQQLRHNQQLLSDGKKISDYYLKQDSTILMTVANTIDAPVKLPIYTGEICTMPIEISDTVASLKDQIYNTKGIPIDKQQILYAGNFLDNYATFASYGYKEGELLICRHKENLSRNVTVELNDENQNKEAFMVNYERSDSIHVMKMQIQQMKKIDVKHQLLNKEGVPLYDGSSISDYSIEPHHTITLKIKEATMNFILPSGKSTKLKFPATKTLNDIKEMLREKFNIRPENQILFHSGQELDGRKHLTDYEIKDDETIEVMVKKYEVELTLQIPNWKETKVRFIQSNLVIDLKAYIEKEHKISAENQELRHLGVPLEDYKMLMDYRIGDGSKIRIDEKNNNTLVVKPVTGDANERITQEFEKTTEVKQLKRIIKERQNIPIDDQLLVYNGEVLENDKTLSSHGIEGRKDVYLFNLSHTRLYLSNIGDQLRILEVPSGNVSLEDVESKFAKNLGVPIKDIAPEAKKFKAILSRIRKGKERANFIHFILDNEKESSLIDLLFS